MKLKKKINEKINIKKYNQKNEDQIWYKSQIGWNNKG
jgi:hypothetical protein